MSNDGNNNNNNIGSTCPFTTGQALKYGTRNTADKCTLTHAHSPFYLFSSALKIAWSRCKILVSLPLILFPTKVISPPNKNKLTFVAIPHRKRAHQKMRQLYGQSPREMLIAEIGSAVCACQLNSNGCRTVEIKLK